MLTGRQSLEALSISDRLARLGYGHRRNAHTETTQKRTVYRLDTGEDIAAMTAAEAAEFAGRLEGGMAS